MSAEQAKETGTQPSPSFSVKHDCGKCGHVKVCAVFRAVDPLMKNWEEQDRPFEATELANICKEFIPFSVFETLKQLGDNP